jgi:hypothetical protein
LKDEVQSISQSSPLRIHKGKIYSGTEKIAYDLNYPEVLKREISVNLQYTDDPLNTLSEILPVRLFLVPGSLIGNFRSEQNLAIAESATLPEMAPILLPNVGRGSGNNPSLSGSLSNAGNLLPPNTNAINEGMVTLSGFSLNYKGKLHKFLDILAEKLDVSWRFVSEKNHVELYRYRTEVFSVYASNNKKSYAVSIGKDSNQNATFESNDNVWQVLEGDLKKFLTQNGQFSLQPSSNQVIVRDKETNIQEIKKYIDSINNAANQQVAMEVILYQITDLKRDVRGIDWNIFFNDGNLKVQQNLVGNLIGGATETYGNVVVGVPATAAGRNLSNFGNTQLIVNSLSRLGKVTRVTSATLKTIHNQPVPFQTITQKNYPKQTKVSLEDGILVQEVSVDVLETGLQMFLRPIVDIPNDRVLLDVSVDFSLTVSIENQTDAQGSNYALPTITRRSFAQRAWINNGNTLLLTGFEDILLDNTKSGTITPGTWYLGGANELENQKDILVMTIRPTFTD